MSDRLKLILGDCIEQMRTLPSESFDSCVVDGPYGIRFMGKAWDGADIVAQSEERKKGKQALSSRGKIRSKPMHEAARSAGTYDLSNRANQAFQEFSRAWSTEVFRLLKPGAHLASFCSTRTYHRMTCGIEDAGFEIRDQLAWVFGQGYPKSSNQDGEWDGWGTALKPAWEPICLARKPLIGTVPENLAAHGCGAININGCRIPVTESDSSQLRTMQKNGSGNDGRHDWGMHDQVARVAVVRADGRWPANLCHDGSPEVLACFPEAPGQMAAASTSTNTRKNQNCYGEMARGNFGAVPRGDQGSAARFFYCAKASKKDRQSGLDGQAANHPTIKPTALMRWLVRLVTPPGGHVLDPMMGSGSTGRGALLEGMRFTGIEREALYFPIAEARCREALGELFA